MFFEIGGETFRFLLRAEDGVWAISYDIPAAPVFLTYACFDACKRLPTPSGYGGDNVLTAAQRHRKELIQPLLNDDANISDKTARRDVATRIAEENNTTLRRILNIYYLYLARGTMGGKREKADEKCSDKYVHFKWAIETFYFSAKRMSLRMAYDLMLTQRYMQEGELSEDAPTWNSFRHYYYDRGFHRQIRKSISRDGLSSYQRQKRTLAGSAMAWRDRVGSFQMDATEADIYLVSRFDRSSVIGRPYIYLAVDVATQLIAGVYVGLKSGDEAVAACLANAAMDKVKFCQSYGINIRPEQWPNTGLPGEIITDQGREFTGARIDELCRLYGMERETLPPFRPDCKGLVEKTFDLIQQRYKPLLRGKGVVERDAQERWATDYRSQAALDLTEFTKVVLHCVIYLNSHRILHSFAPSLEMAEAGVEAIPAKLWSWYDRMGRSDIVPINADDAYQLALHRTQARLTRKGVLYEGLYYQSNNYIQLIQKYGLTQKVTIGVDTDCIDCIYLIDAGNYIPLTLSASCAQYHGLTQLEHGLFIEKVYQQKKQLQLEETKASIKLLQNINEVIGEVSCAKKERQTGERIRQNRVDERRKRS